MRRGGRAGTDYPLAVLRKPDVFIGMCGVHPSQDWEIGYWLGKPFWGSGYATEAARRRSRAPSRTLKAETLKAGWFHDNPASGHVLAKLGFRPAGEEERSCVSRGGHGCLSPRRA